VWHYEWVKKVALLSVIVAFFFASQGSLNASQVNSSATTIPAAYDLENEPSECIGFLPKPGCGKEPEDAGDRGGSLQYLTFVIMILGLCVVGFGITRSVKKQRPTKP